MVSSLISLGKPRKHHCFLSMLPAADQLWVPPPRVLLILGTFVLTICCSENDHSEISLWIVDSPSPCMILSHPLKRFSCDLRGAIVIMADDSHYPSCLGVYTLYFFCDLSAGSRLVFLSAPILFLTGRCLYLLHWVLLCTAAVFNFLNPHRTD